LPPAKPAWPGWLRWALVGTAVVLAFSAGFVFGRFPIEWSSDNGDGPPQPNPAQDKALGQAK
jgi:hypothetical protein